MRILSKTQLPPAPISPYLSTFSVFLHTQRRHMFPENQSFRRFVLDIRRIIREEHAATLDSWCFPKERLPCWLMAHQYPLNKLLVLYEIEIVQVQPGTFLLHHVGNDYAKRENAAAILERARAMYVEPAQFLYERECMVTWLLRVHRCIQQLRIQLSELVESPEEFCQLFKLHGKYTILDLAVSATTSLSGRSLFLFIDNSSALTELSFTGMRLVHPSDNFSLGVLVAANRLLRKIAFHRCQIADGNLSGIVGVAMGLAYLESFSISLCNSESSIERSEQLRRLLATNDRRCLRQFCLGVGCDLKPIIDTLCANRSLVDVRITQPISTPSELTKLCTLAGANRHLKHLHLSIDFESALSRKYNQHALSKFVENAKLDLLKLENCVFTMRGVKAIAEGLKKNGIEGMLWRDAEFWPTPTSHSHQRYLKALRLRGEDLTCEHLNVILEALEANRTLEMLDVGRVRSSLSISHADVTQKIIDDALRQRERQALSLQSNPVAAVRVNKVHFAEEFQLLLSAMRNDVTFRKLKLSFCDVSRETFDAHSFHFSYLLTVLPFYAVAETLETLEIDVSLPGIHDVTFLGLSILVATSKTLTDLRITLGDTCGEFTSILLLQGLASSISIRSLTMSGWGLKYPVSLWFRQFCTMNQTLRKLHIHVANREDESNAAFIEALPKTLMNCQWLVDFQFTCGKPAEAVFLPDVLSLIGSNKKLHSLAIKMVITAATVPREVENVFEKMLTLEMGVRLRRCMDSPGFTEAIAERSWLSTDATERAISTTKALISKVLGRRAKVHRRVRPSSPDLSDTDATLSGDMDEPTQERLFRSIRVGSSSSWHCRDISVDKYQMRLSKVSHTMATIYNEERKYFTSLVESLVKQIADFSISGPAGDTFGAPVSFS
ncbi:hypothetical protein HPB50_001068 [Hyalomma asiaticum]|uniref:Uncharacterized protein n=1 Tax=Hyalomma asiaticum TaxID=266040 RepID=A0ACB7RNG8_HYAAI|nr:hypothetical protein HPB50_001068 [Hyalomma asiaticum]